MQPDVIDLCYFKLWTLIDQIIMFWKKQRFISTINQFLRISMYWGHWCHPYIKVRAKKPLLTLPNIQPLFDSSTFSRFYKSSKAKQRTSEVVSCMLIWFSHEYGLNLMFFFNSSLDVCTQHCGNFYIQFESRRLNPTSGMPPPSFRLPPPRQH